MKLKFLWVKNPKKKIKQFHMVQQSKENVTFTKINKFVTAKMD